MHVLHVYMSNDYFFRNAMLSKSHIDEFRTQGVFLFVRSCLITLTLNYITVFELHYIYILNRNHFVYYSTRGVTLRRERITIKLIQFLIYLRNYKKFIATNLGNNLNFGAKKCYSYTF